jgi:hypothetical protein
MVHGIDISPDLGPNSDNNGKRGQTAHDNNSSRERWK